MCSRIVKIIDVAVIVCLQVISVDFVITHYEKVLFSFVRDDTSDKTGQFNLSNDLEPLLVDNSDHLLSTNEVAIHRFISDANIEISKLSYGLFDDLIGFNISNNSILSALFHHENMLGISRDL